jgi:type II secretory pathway component PulF
VSESQAVLPLSNPEARVFTWIATILACAYILWSGTMLYWSTPRFIDLYSSLGVDLPLATRIVSAVYRFAYPLLFGGATALIITKQFYVRAKWINMGITLASTLVVDIISRATIWALYRPIFDLTEKLNK